MFKPKQKWHWVNPPESAVRFTMKPVRSPWPVISGLLAVALVATVGGVILETKIYSGPHPTMAISTTVRPMVTTTTATTEPPTTTTVPTTTAPPPPPPPTAPPTTAPPPPVYGQAEVDYRNLYAAWMLMSKSERARICDPLSTDLGRSFFLDRLQADYSYTSVQRWIIVVVSECNSGTI